MTEDVDEWSSPGWDRRQWYVWELVTAQDIQNQIWNSVESKSMNKQNKRGLHCKIVYYSWDIHPQTK